MMSPRHSSKGFTLLEILTVIAILGVIVSLLFGLLSRFIRISRTGDTRLQCVDASVRLLDLTASDLMRLAPEYPITLLKDECVFTVRRGRTMEDVRIRSNADSTSSYIRKPNAPEPSIEKSFPCSITFAFMQGTEWTDRWESERPPAAVRMTVHPKTSGSVVMQPFVLTMDVPAGIDEHSRSQQGEGR